MDDLKLKLHAKSIALISFFLIFPLIISNIQIGNVKYITTVKGNTEDIICNKGPEVSLTLKTAGYNTPVITSPNSILRRTGYDSFIEFTVNDDDLSTGEAGGTYNLTLNDGSTYTLLGNRDLPWNAGVQITHPIPFTTPNYNFTIFVEDEDGNKVNKTITSSFNDLLPYLECITVVQGGEEYNIKDQKQSGVMEYDYRPYISTGEGNFALRLHWQDWSTLTVPNQVRRVSVDLQGYLDYFGFEFFLSALGNEFTLKAEPLSTNTWTGTYNNQEYGYWLLILWIVTGYAYHSSYTFLPGSAQTYTWNWWFIHQILSPLFADWVQPIQNVAYLIENRFTINIMTGTLLQTANNYFIYNQQIHNGDYDVILQNKDVTAPSVGEISANQTDSDSNFEVYAKITDEAYGSGVNEGSQTLFYQPQGSGWMTDNMILLEDGFFHGNIPPPDLGTSVSYYIQTMDMEGNTINSDIYTCYAEPYEVPPVVITLIGVLAVTIGAVAITLIYRRRNQPAIITLPSKKKVDKYYKKINKEEG